MARDLQEIYTNEQYQIAEGQVHVMREEPYKVHAPGDMISIGGVVFEYSYFATNAPYYHQTIAHGGVLTQNKLVRVHHYKDKIIEIFAVE